MKLVDYSGGESCVKLLDLRSTFEYLQANIEAAKLLGIERITISLTLTEASVLNELLRDSYEFKMVIGSLKYGAVGEIVG